MIYRNWDGYIIQISRLNKFKKPILLVGKGNEATKVASFDSDEAAEKFMKTFEKFVTITQGGNKHDQSRTH